MSGKSIQVSTVYKKLQKNVTYVPGLDQYITNFIIGSKTIPNNCYVMRGISKYPQRSILYCRENNIDFYTIDTGYIQPTPVKHYHRITKNALQNLGPIVSRPSDRFDKLNFVIKKKKHKGEYILICPPSSKVMNFYGLDVNVWISGIIDEIKKYTDRPVNIRLKQTRTIRTTTDTIWNALKNAYCMITFNSIAASESLLAGVPAIALTHNAASVLCNNAIEQINNLNRPSIEELTEFAKHLSYCQFTVHEMKNGTAWRILNDN